jgi:ABC-2 type transport system permease protein
MSSLQRIFALAIKEFQALLRDKKSRFVIIVPPIVQLLIFSFAATFDLNHIRLAVYDEDHGHAASSLIARFAGSGHFSLTEPVHNQAQLEQRIDEGQALMVLHLPADFSRQLHQNHQAPAQLIIDGRNSNTAAIALSYANHIVDQYNTDWAKSHGLPNPPSILVTRAWFNPNLESRWFIVPGVVGLLMLVVVMVVTALSVAREREQGTFDQLLVTPLHPAEILLGKALPGLVIGLFEASLIVLIAVYSFDVPLLGSLATLYAGIILFLLSASGVGLMISALSATLQQAVLGVFLFLVPAIILSGFATPIANMPPLVQDLTLINPLRYFMIILRGVFLEGAGFNELYDQFWPLAVIGLFSLLIAGWLFRHRMA